MAGVRSPRPQTPVQDRLQHRPDGAGGGTMNTLRLVSRAALVFGLAVPAAPLSAQTIAITGGTVYPVSGPKLVNATIVIEAGRIKAIGANVPVPAGATRVDLSLIHISEPTRLLSISY